MKKILSIFLIVLIGLNLVACGSQEKDKSLAVAYKDGTYTGQSSKDDRGGYIKVEIIVKDSKIESAIMENIDNDGKEKDETYGQSQNEGLYKIAQQAINLAKSYPDELVKNGSPEAVDVISGATESYTQFIEACDIALDQAKQ